MNFGQKITIGLLLSIALCLPLHAEIVNIPDPNLAQAVRKALELPPNVQLTDNHLKQLNELEANAQDITDLTGLEYAINLRRLHIPRNSISDLMPIANLNALTYLDIGVGELSDIKPIEHLTNLTTLLLSINRITDVSPLANLVNLTHLRVNVNKITDINPFAKLTNLTYLSANGNRIVDISSLANLTRLTHLYLNNNNIADVAPLANLTNLTHLELEGNNIRDVAPLASLAKLEHLNTQNNPIFAPDNPLVDIPDPNLRTAVREALHLPADALITQADMLRLVELPAERRSITDLTGLEYALNLKILLLQGNRGANLAPLAGLTKLEHLALIGNSISDISPLASLTQLRRLALRGNLISDIRPLAGLTALTHLALQRNLISDVRPLGGLHNLERLEIQDNPIVDYSPLDALPLTYFTYDQSCDMPPEPLEPRLENRTFPSIYGAFTEHIKNRPDINAIEDYWERRIAMGALHDMYFSGPSMFNLRYRQIDEDWHLRGLLPNALEHRNRYLAQNPNKVFIAEVRWRDSGEFGEFGHFPDNHPYWIKDTTGEIPDEGKLRLINYAHPVVQDIIVGQALAVSKCGLFDGIFFDWWDDFQSSVGDYIPNDIAQRARLNIIRRIRERARPNFLILGNVNNRIAPITGPYINGGFMESTVPSIGDPLAQAWTEGFAVRAPTEEAFAVVRNSLQWLEENLRQPRINALQGGSDTREPPDSPTNLRWMRAYTTMSLTHSDGYVLFGIGASDVHYWYDFWDANLGRPVGPKFQFYKDVEGLYIREFTNGWAVCNHSGEAQVITLPEAVQGVASGVVNTEHALPNLDGEIYLRKTVTSKNPADVNGDGAVNILDLVAVAQAFGKDGLQGDVNGDGVVNVFDLVFVAGAIGGGGAAPSAYSPDPSIISAADVESWLALAGGLSVGDANFQRGIRFLEGLLAALTPKETTLLPNYPNPFNPETWIPYHLARETEVSITIYDTKGTPVRRLALGNQAAGHYAARGKAAYWDGLNERGEAVASGIYIYQFRAGDYAASRRMVIVK